MFFDPSAMSLVHMNKAHSHENKGHQMTGDSDSCMYDVILE